MAIDVSKPSSSDYPTKPTPPVSPPPHRDYQRNKNQTIPTTTTKDQDFDTEIPTITTKDQAIDVPQDFSWFTFDTTTATTTATTADQNRNQKDSSEMTPEEEFQHWEEEHYEAEDRAEQAAWPKNKWMSAIMALDSDIFAPIDEPTTATTTKNDDATAATAAADTPIHEVTPAPVPTTTDNTHTNTTTDHEFPNTSVICATKETSDTPTCKISDSTVNTTNKASLSKIIENTTNVHTATYVHATNTTTGHKFYTTCDTTDDASDTMSISSDSTLRTTNTAPDFNIIENTTIVHTTTTTDTTETPIAFPTATIPILSPPPTRNQAPTMIEEEPNPPIIDNTTTTGDEEEVSSPPRMFDIDDEFTTSNTTEEEEEDEKSNNYYDNIDNDILQNEESTIVFEDNISATAVRATNNQSIPMTTANDIISNISQLFPATTAKDRRVTKAVLMFIEEFEEDTVEDGLGVLLEDPFDYDTRETVREILMEHMLSDFDLDETRRTSFCDILFGLLDKEQQQQQQIDISTANTSPLVTPPTHTKTKSRPKPNTVTNKKKKQTAIIEHTTTVHTTDKVHTTNTTTDNNPNDSIIKDLLTTERFDMIVGLLNEDTLDFVIGILSDNSSDDHREVVRGILMEALTPVNDVVDGAGVCDSLFALLDMDKHDDTNIPGRSDHLLFTAAERVVPIGYPIKITEPTATDKLLDAEHNEFLKQGISFPELPKHIQEYLRQQQVKQKQHMIDIQAPYTVAAHLQKTMKEHIREQHKKKQARETKRLHKQAVEREQAEQNWHQNNNKRLRSEESEREANKEKERATARRRCETARLELEQQLPKKQQQRALKQQQHQVQLLQRREKQQQQVQQLKDQQEQDHERMKQHLEQRQQQQQELKKLFEIEQQQISKNRKIVSAAVSAARSGKGKRKKKVQCVSNRTSGESRTSSADPGTFGMEFGMQMIADQFGDGWHKTLTRFSGVQRIAALFGDGVT